MGVLLEKAILKIYLRTAFMTSNTQEVNKKNHVKAMASSIFH